MKTERLFAFLLTSLLLVSPITVHAETTIISQDEAIRWLNSDAVMGKTISTPYGYAGECASLGYQYYKKLLGREIRANAGGTGNGNDYDDYNHSTGLGWDSQKISVSTILQPGDVIVWNPDTNDASGNTKNHVAIFISGSPTNATVIHQNWGGRYVKKSSNLRLVTCTYVRPNWKNHTHSFVINHENAHPHREYRKCSCGYLEYTGKYITLPNCVQCAMPGKPKLLTMQSHYITNQTISFIWEETANTTHYNLYLRKQIPSGEYKFYENIFYATSRITRQLEAGEYCVVLESKNSNAYKDDSSDWLSTAGDPYYFSVSDDYVSQLLREYNEHSYIMFDYSLGWKAAQRVCENLGGYLATVNSLAENEILVSLIQQGEMDRYYLGGTDEQEEGNWKWITDEKWTIDKLWTPGEPTNSNNSEHYITLEKSTGLWNDVIEQDFRRGFICEIEKPLAEVCIPKASSEFNNHRYLLFDNTVSWRNAKSICEIMGGYLATVNSFEEQEFLSSFAIQGEKRRYYLGGTDEHDEGNWKWVTDEEWNINTLWAPGEPTNTNNSEHYITLEKNTGLWNDVPMEGFERGFICEIENPRTKSTVTSKNANIVVNTTLFGVDSSSKIIIAGYLENQFVSTQLISVSKNMITTEFSTKIDTVKVMVWDSIEGLRPVTKEETIPKNEWFIE